MILGLTGGIATGKSTASKFFIEKGIKVIDSDNISHEVINKQDIINKLVLEFGNDILEENKINRKKLRKIVFENENNTKKLNDIMLPEIIKEIENKINEYKKTEKLFIIDAPTLFESNLEYIVDKILLISSDYETQVQRVLVRDKTDLKDANNIINRQMSMKLKEEKSDYIIYNNGSLDQFYEQLEVFYKDIVNSI